MRSMDLYVERSIRDGSPDKIASLQMLNEARAVTITNVTRTEGNHEKKAAKADDKSKSAGNDLNSAEGMGGRDKIAMLSIVLCNPLMMLGIGTSFAIWDGMRHAKDANAQALKDAPRRSFEKPEDEQNQIKEALLALATENRTLDQDVFRLEDERKEKLNYKNRKNSILFPNQMEFRPPSPERSWVKASKILKRKLALKDMLEKYKGDLELSTVSALVSQIDKLDKELTKMGC